MKQYWYNCKDAFKPLKHIHYSVISSTQLEGRKVISQSADIPLLITADAQTHGIGQHKRQWHSPDHVNIYATLVLNWPHDKQNLIFHLPHITTLTIAGLLDNILFPHGLKSHIKWINDILVDNKKIGGVLCENYFDGSSHSKVLIGMGLNINMTQKDCDALDQPATSLKIQTGKTWDKNLILNDLIDLLFNNLTQLIHTGFSSFHQSVQNKIIFLNEIITLDHQGQIYQGLFKGITQSGELILLIDEDEKVFNQGRILRTRSESH